MVIYPRKIMYLASLLSAFALIAGCSNSGEDVRVTLCKDLVTELLDPPHAMNWTETRNDIRRADSLTVHLRFETADQDGTASCGYRYTAVDDTAATLADPLSAYSTSPERMTLNGQSIHNPRLAKAIGQAMLKQGREVLERARHGFDAAARQIQAPPPDQSSH